MNIGAKAWIAVSATALLLTGAAATSPWALRRVDAFRVGSIELDGARYLTPQDVALAAGITDSASLFDPFLPWRAALEQHPLVAQASFARRLPDVLVVHVVESEPVALISAPELRPVDVRGRVLPIDPLATQLDLPILAGDLRVDSTGTIASAAARGALDVLDRIARAQPWLLAWISELEPVRGGVGLRLRWPMGAEILLPLEPDAGRLHELRLAIGDLAARDSVGGPDGGELERLIRIDARYRDQLVVRLAPGRANRSRGAS